MNLAFNKNEDELKLLISEMARRHAKIEKGGGEKKLQKQRDSGKLTARERISFLVDKKKPCLEIGSFAGDDVLQAELS
jgi:acetyl-CoA carboxylase carboxyltransferase component